MVVAAEVWKYLVGRSEWTRDFTLSCSCAAACWPTVEDSHGNEQLRGVNQCEAENQQVLNIPKQSNFQIYLLQTIYSSSLTDIHRSGNGYLITSSNMPHLLFIILYATASLCYTPKLHCTKTLACTITESWTSLHIWASFCNSICHIKVCFGGPEQLVTKVYNLSTRNETVTG